MAALTCKLKKNGFGKGPFTIGQEDGIAFLHPEHHSYMV
jgi:hypothetical protein